MYTRISSSVSSTSYADSTAEAPVNGVYYYVVTAVDAQGIESGFSNEVSVTIPNQ
jgi:fibronectin type 3 domain-containing protein